MIEFNDVSKNYGKAKALDGFSWSVGEGEIHGLLGHNGSGKTTSFLIANNLADYNGGSVKIFNKEPKHLTSEENQKIGLLTEKLKIYQDLTIKENLNFFCDIFSIKNKKSKIGEIAELFDFDEYINKKIKQLSTGMYKKAVIGLTFLNDPSVVFLDEPFAGLDPVVVKQISQALRYYKEEKNTTIIVSSHNLHEIETIADKITIMKSGTHVLSESLSDIFTKYDIEKDYTVTYLQNNKEITEVIDNPDALSIKIMDIKSEGSVLLKISDNKISLVDIYNKIYTN